MRFSHEFEQNPLFHRDGLGYTAVIPIESGYEDERACQGSFKGFPGSSDALADDDSSLCLLYRLQLHSDGWCVLCVHEVRIQTGVFSQSLHWAGEFCVSVQKRNSVAVNDKNAALQSGVYPVWKRRSDSLRAVFERSGKQALCARLADHHLP